MGDITVVIPCHPYRIKNGYLDRAIASTYNQELRPSKVLVQLDELGEGAPMTRHKGLMQVETEWVAFLDSDDYFFPNHLRVLKDAADLHKADYVYSWYCVIGGTWTDPMPHLFGKPWSNEAPRQTTITTLVKTSLAQQVGFLNYRPFEMFDQTHEDWFFMKGCLRKGATIIHVPERTWAWTNHEGNTSGKPDKGDARV